MSHHPAWTYICASDFTNAVPWTIDTIYVPGNDSGGRSLTRRSPGRSTPTAAAVPDGNPLGGNPPFWSLTLTLNDSQLVITGTSMANLANTSAPFDHAGPSPGGALVAGLLSDDERLCRAFTGVYRRESRSSGISTQYDRRFPVDLGGDFGFGLSPSGWKEALPVPRP